MDFEIRNKNMHYENEEVKSVTVNFSAKTEDRSISLNGRFTMTADEYNKDSSISALNEKAKQHVLDELQK